MRDSNKENVHGVCIVFMTWRSAVGYRYFLVLVRVVELE